MDALYLKNNVYTALTEALASMAVALPDDKVEYLGKYLLKYVDRKKIKEEIDLSLQDILLREEAENLNNSIAQEAEVANKKRDNDNYLTKQKTEQIMFAEENANIHESLVEILRTIEELDIAAFAVAPVAEPISLEYDEDGNLITEKQEEPDASTPQTPIAADLETEGDADTHNGEEEKYENGEKPLTLVDLENNEKSLKVLTLLLRPDFGVSDALYCMQQWTTNNLHQYSTPMDDRVVSLLHFLGVTVGMDPVLSLDPQTGKPSWKVIRMGLIGQVTKAMRQYDVTSVRTVPLTSSYGYVKECCLALDLFEVSSYPKCFPATEILCMWLKRALFAREQAVLFHAQQGHMLEIITGDGKDLNQEEDDE